MLKSLAYIIVASADILALALVCGAIHSKAGSRVLRDGLAAAHTDQAESVDFRELDGLPAPVERYLRIALKEGMSVVVDAWVNRRGIFNMGQTADQRKPFTSDQMLVTRRPGFDSHGRIAMFPALIKHLALPCVARLFSINQPVQPEHQCGRLWLPQ
jgi:hypothetical protein